LPLIIGGDGLFSDSTITKHIKSLGMHYLFTCKSGDHKYLMQCLGDYKDDWPWVEHTDDKKDTPRYRWRNQVPLSGQANAPLVNYLESQNLRISESQNLRAGKMIYYNSWVTDIEVTSANIFGCSSFMTTSYLNCLG
jgi:hypothetical protein